MLYTTIRQESPDIAPIMINQLRKCLFIDDLSDYDIEKVIEDVNPVIQYHSRTGVLKMQAHYMASICSRLWKVIEQ